MQMLDFISGSIFRNLKHVQNGTCLYVESDANGHHEYNFQIIIRFLQGLV